jgi:alpha-amylase/alpha-mannosidase (GH57 family)
LAIGIIGLLTLGACSPAGVPSPDPTPPILASSTSAAPSSTTIAPTVAPPEPLLDPAGSYAVVVFTNHLPEYGQAAEGSADRPWARLHTTRDYLTMIRLIAETRAKVVLSYSPVLLEQIADVAAGRWDQAALLTAKPANELTDEDKAYIDEVFFLTDPSQIDRYPRYRELATRRALGRQLTTGEYRDLQVLFNLSWTSPLLLEEEDLAASAAKGRGFSEDDKQVILDAHRAAAAEFLSTLQSLWVGGVIEVATTPLTNPVLPLLIRNRMDQDASDQIVFGAERAAAVLGDTPQGIAPARGLIDQANLAAALRAGFEWLLLSGPESPQPFQLTSESGSVLALVAAPQPGSRIADTYFAMDPDAAARDMIDAMAATIEESPGAVATFAADGTEPWSRYADGGLAFLRRLFERLQAAQSFSAALPSELTEAFHFDPGPYPDLPDTYLRSREELAAWALLADTRQELLRQRQAGAADPAALDGAYEHILRAEGADWYWWYSPQRASGEDDYYDESFRNGLSAAWSLLGASPPDQLLVPLQDKEPLAATRPNQSVTAAVTIDNSIVDTEWSTAGVFEERSSDLIERVHYTFDSSRLFVRVDFTSEVLGDSAPGFDLYLRGPTGTGDALTPLRNAIGFDAAIVAKWRGTSPVQISLNQPYRSDRSTRDQAVSIGFDGDSVEFALDLALIEPAIRAGDHIEFRFFDVTGGPESSRFPAAAPGLFEFPNLEESTELANISDQSGDDHGPGDYTYIVDSETRSGTYDLAGFAARLIGASTPDGGADAAGELQFEITFRDPLGNPWFAPAGFSHQTVDLYIDVGTGDGAQRLLPGRVAATEAGNSWHYAFTMDGWGASRYSVDATGAVWRVNAAVDFKLLADKRTILVRVPRADLPPGDTTQWRYGVAILANRAIPSLGSHGLRGLAREPGKLTLGGGTGADNDPLIIDLLHPDAGAQETLLTYPAPGAGAESDLDIDQLARLPMLAG